jgi:hypothetical protein
VELNLRISFLKTSQKVQMRKVTLVASAFFLFGFLSSCKLFDEVRPKSVEQKPSDSQKEMSADPLNAMMTKGEVFNFHRWLIKEMQEQILVRPANNDQDINGWANVLSQRGSIEGVYHGFVLSAEYGAKETGKPELKAVRFFAQEMAAFDFPNAKDGDPEMAKAAEKYAKENMGTPLFVMKRFLGDRILKESIARKADKERLASWYSGFVGRWSKAGVPFGHKQRDSGTEAYHYKWALDNNLGMVQWELLNRMHRIMNAYGGVALPVPAASSAPSTTPTQPNPAGK